MRYHNANIRQAQQRFIRSQRTETDCLTAFNLLTDDLLFDELEKLLPEHRERLFPPTETLATTLNCPKTSSKKSLKSLYKQRWNVELDIRNIKETMDINILTCKTPEMVTKEIWVYLLAYNLIRYLMVQAAAGAGILPREISFKHSLQL
jgi:hypothetical protein